MPEFNAVRDGLILLTRETDSEIIIEFNVILFVKLADQSSGKLQDDPLAKTCSVCKGENAFYKHIIGHVGQFTSATAWYEVSGEPEISSFARRPRGLERRWSSVSPANH
jgi:hypothetical protein